MSLLSLTILVPMAVDTVRHPRAVFARLLGLNLSVSILWNALALVVIVSVLLAEATALVMRPADPEVVGGLIVPSPFIFTAIQFAVLAGIVLLIDGLGRGMGGRGDRAGALLVIVWLQFVMICLQVVQSLAIILLPPLAVLIVIGGLVLFLWLLTNFIAELHGFASLGRVFGMIAFTMIGAALGLSLILTLLGVTVTQ